jgi:thiamine pyrophosphate-dependent acetolactate synthase large subunit-like protein
VQEVSPYELFATASLYTGRILNPAQTRAAVQTAIRTALVENGPTVISMPGEVASQHAGDEAYQLVSVRRPVLRPGDADLRELASMIDEAKTVTIFGGDGCRDAHDEVVALAQKLGAPVGYAYRGKQWLEWENPNTVGMSGLLGWGGGAGPGWTWPWSATSRTRSPRCCRWSRPSFAKVADALGIAGFRLEKADEVRATVERFLAVPGPAVLDAVVDRRALSLPPHVSLGEAEGFSLSLAKQAIHGKLDDVIETVTHNVRLA